MGTRICQGQAVDSSKIAKSAPSLEPAIFENLAISGRAFEIGNMTSLAGRVKTLRKKLHQIDNLECRLEMGEAIDEQQAEKLSRKSEFLSELLVCEEELRRLESEHGEESSWTSVSSGKPPRSSKSFDSRSKTPPKQPPNQVSILGMSCEHLIQSVCVLGGLFFGRTRASLTGSLYYSFGQIVDRLLPYLYP